MLLDQFVVDILEYINRAGTSTHNNRVQGDLFICGQKYPCKWWPFWPQLRHLGPLCRIIILVIVADISRIAMRISLAMTVTLNLAPTTIVLASCACGWCGRENRENIKMRRRSSFGLIRVRSRPASEVFPLRNAHLCSV